MTGGERRGDPPSRTVLVPGERVPRWFTNFGTRHGEPAFTVDGGGFYAVAPDGARAVARLPFGRAYDGPPEVRTFAEAVPLDIAWAVLLVRKGGFAVASVHGDRVGASKVGRRHVQGRTKAGGQSQQRFARRRANQARQAFEAAADHAHRLLVTESGDLEALVCGGDRTAVDEVLADPRLVHLGALRTGPWLPVPDPRRSVLDQAVRDGCSVAVEVTEPR